MTKRWRVEVWQATIGDHAEYLGVVILDAEHAIAASMTAMMRMREEHKLSDEVRLRTVVEDVT